MSASALPAALSVSSVSASIRRCSAPTFGFAISSSGTSIILQFVVSLAAVRVVPSLRVAAVRRPVRPPPCLPRTMQPTTVPTSGGPDACRPSSARPMPASGRGATTCARLDRCQRAQRAFTLAVLQIHVPGARQRRDHRLDGRRTARSAVVADPDPPPAAPCRRPAPSGRARASASAARSACRGRTVSAPPPCVRFRQGSPARRCCFPRPRVRGRRSRRRVASCHLDFAPARSGRTPLSCSRRTRANPDSCAGLVFKGRELASPSRRKAPAGSPPALPHRLHDPADRRRASRRRSSTPERRRGSTRPSSARRLSVKYGGEFDGQVRGEAPGVVRRRRVVDQPAEQSAAGGGQTVVAQTAGVRAVAPNERLTHCCRTVRAPTPVHRRTRMPKGCLRDSARIRSVRGAGAKFYHDQGRTGRSSG